MRFRNDEQRKAVFANMFEKSESKSSRVSSFNVKNFETKPKMTVIKPKISGAGRFERSRMKPIKKVKKYDHGCAPCSVNYGHHIQLSETKGKQLNQDIFLYIQEKPRTLEEIEKKFNLSERSVKYRVGKLRKAGTVEAVPFLHDLRQSFFQATGAVADPRARPKEVVKRKKPGELKNEVLDAVSYSTPKKIRELANEIDVTPTTIQNNLNKLIEEGKVRRVSMTRKDAGVGRRRKEHDFFVSRHQSSGYLRTE